MRCTAYLHMYYSILYTCVYKCRRQLNESRARKSNCICIIIYISNIERALWSSHIDSFELEKTSRSINTKQAVGDQIINESRTKINFVMTSFKNATGEKIFVNAEQVLSFSSSFIEADK